MRSVEWRPRDPRDFVEDKLTVTITLMEYRELLGKAALYDAEHASPNQVEKAPRTVRIGDDDAMLLSHEASVDAD